MMKVISLLLLIIFVSISEDTKYYGARWTIKKNSFASQVY